MHTHTHTHTNTHIFFSSFLSQEPESLHTNERKWLRQRQLHLVCKLLWEWVCAGICVFVCLGWNHVHPAVSPLSGVGADKTQSIHLPSVGLVSCYLTLHSIYLVLPLFILSIFLSLSPFISLHALFLLPLSPLDFPHHSHLYLFFTEQKQWGSIKGPLFFFYIFVANALKMCQQALFSLVVQRKKGRGGFIGLFSVVAPVVVKHAVWVQ